MNAVEGSRDLDVPTFDTKHLKKEELAELYKQITRMYETSPKLRYHQIKQRIRKRVDMSLYPWKSRWDLLGVLSRNRLKRVDVGAGTYWDF
jgi:hypothetical protein